MDVLAYLLDGLEAELELERELGVRAVECDKALLAEFRGGFAGDGARDAPSEQRRIAAPSAPFAPAAAPAAGRPRRFAFLNDRPLSPRAAEMVAKITAAMGETAESAPTVHEGAMPEAKVYVVLGALALKKWIPGVAAGPGDWIRTKDGASALVVYSPEKLSRYSVVTPVVAKMKRDMWNSLKSAARRVAAEE